MPLLKCVAMKYRIITMLLGLLLLYACSKSDSVTNTDSITSTLTEYQIKRPVRFPEMYIPNDNKPYKERITLGRMLYYDPILSNDGRSCSSCHLQTMGFTIAGSAGSMPVLPHVNLGWNTNYMWNGSKKGTLEDVMIFETEEFFATDLNRINNNEKYVQLFRQSYGIDKITHKYIGYALAQFTRTLISDNTKYDRYMNGTDVYTYNEEMGRKIFFSEKGDCFHCHVTLITTDNDFHNNGLDSIYTADKDKGLYNVTKSVNDLGKFKTPNLRNVALRKTFMHDGRFTSLEEVIDFYNSKVKKSASVDPVMLKPGKENGLQLSTIEKSHLIAFLKTLTDSTFISAVEFSKP